MAISFGEQGKAVYAKVWSTEDKGNYVKAQISTSRKDKKTDQYINSSWFASFVGNCVDKAKNLGRGDSIKIMSGQLENKKNDDGKSYVNMVIFAFDLPDGEGQQSSSSRPVNSKRTQNLDVPPSREDDDEDCPF